VDKLHYFECAHFSFTFGCSTLKETARNVNCDETIKENQKLNLVDPENCSSDHLVSDQINAFSLM
jgi:hypothetical protein